MDSSGKSCLREVLRVQYLAVFSMFLLSLYVLLIARGSFNLFFRGVFQ
ncbi:MAG: hypothetical protein HOC71_16860 [Candidatus Latescibacteria bacterium]|nr:hypothetical protein [Candidatus Latescibacterota bacterium]